ncbi:hypothetical protein [Nocardioides mangrovicus]|nr:hypothetical protein [Nocardioides mangrovicus]
MSRRSLFTSTGTIGLATAVGAASASDLLLPPAAQAAAGSKPFDVTQPSTKLFGQTSLSYRSGWQAFAYSSMDDEFLYVQPCNPDGITVAKQRGDLRLSSITASGKVSSSSFMQLNGFGHGTTMGVMPSVAHSYVWLETAGHVETSGGNAAGRQICCFRWTGDGKSYSVSDLGTSKMPYSGRFTLRPGSTYNSVSYDESTGRLLLRYRASDGKYYYEQYDADTVRANGTAPIVAGTKTIPESAVIPSVPGSYQSYTMYGDYVYVLKGSKVHNCPEQSTFDSSITSFRLDGTEKPVTHSMVSNGSVPGREVEGICVQAEGSTKRLVFGIKADGACSGSDAKYQTTAAYYKTAFAT